VLPFEIMMISVVNRTGGAVSDEELLRVIRAVNRQVRDDFEPSWGMGATLRLEGETGRRWSPDDLVELRGDAILFLEKLVPTSDVDGYHEANVAGIPYGVVQVDLAAELEEPWSVTFSHEVLELIADPQSNLLVAGPEPGPGRRRVLFWYEVCDAVQAETYEIDGVGVSNFVLPLYFTEGHEIGGRNDFLGRRHGKHPLRSFGVNPGGYVGYTLPATGKTVIYEADEAATKRRRVKGKAKLTRRSTRYARLLSARKR
jgi:hypothetical protein